MTVELDPFTCRWILGGCGVPLLLGWCYCFGAWIESSRENIPEGAETKWKPREQHRTGIWCLGVVFFLLAAGCEVTVFFWGDQDRNARHAAEDAEKRDRERLEGIRASEEKAAWHEAHRRQGLADCLAGVPSDAAPAAGREPWLEGGREGKRKLPLTGQGR